MPYLSDYMSEAQTNLFNDIGAFFAFSNKQFEEGKREDTKYVSIGGGLLCPQGKAKELVDGLDDIYDKGIRRDVKENGTEGIIEREYFNYECQISYRHDEVLEALEGYIERFPDKFTKEKINQVFKNCWKKALENNWF